MSLMEALGATTPEEASERMRQLDLADENSSATPDAAESDTWLSRENSIHMPTWTEKSADQRVRETYHWPPRVLDADDKGMYFVANKNWMPLISEPHKILVLLTQLFYDIAYLVSADKMSTTVLNDIKNNIIVVGSKNLPYINEDLFHVYRGRHSLALFDGPKIGDKTNWLRSQVGDVRKRHPSLGDLTRAVQVDDIAHRMFRALTKKTVPERRHALDRLPDQILIDTRSSLGHPKTWVGLPVNPLPRSKALFRRLPDDTWLQWIERAGVPYEILNSLKPTLLDTKIRYPDPTEPLPWWWAESESLRDFLDPAPWRRG
jgi:hypothetical protein